MRTYQFKSERKLVQFCLYFIDFDGTGLLARLLANVINEFNCSWIGR